MKAVVLEKFGADRRGTTRAFGRKGFKLPGLVKLRGLARFRPGEFELHRPGQLAVA